MTSVRYCASAGRRESTATHRDEITQHPYEGPGLAYDPSKLLMVPIVIGNTDVESF